MKYPFWFSFVWMFESLIGFPLALGGTVSIKDPNADYQMKVNSDGSINVNAGSGGPVSVTQGTIPWIVNGSSYPQPVTGTFWQSVQPVSQSGTWTVLSVQSGTWSTGRTWTLSNGSDSITDFQGTSPWIISGIVVANAGTGNFTVAQSSGSNLHADIDNFPITQAVTQSTSPWVVSGAITANQGSPPWSVSQSGVWTTGRTWALLNTTDSVNVGNFPSTFGVTQSTSPWVTNISQFGSNNVVTGTGASGLGIPRVTVSNDSSVGLNPGTNAFGYLSGRTVLSTFTQNYTSSNLSTSSFTTIISSTSSTINEEDIFDNSGGLWYLAYAATCGTLSNSSNAVIIGPGGGGKDFFIPSGNCLGFEALGSNITSGNVYMTFYK